MLGEKLRSDAFLRRLVRDCLGAILAKLEDLPLLVRTRPGAALAIKSGHVVDLQKGFRRSNRSHLADAVEHSVPNRGDAGRLCGSRADAELSQIQGVLRLQRNSIIRIQFGGVLWAAAGRSLLAQVLL